MSVSLEAVLGSNRGDIFILKGVVSYFFLFGSQEKKMLKLKSGLLRVNI